MVRVTITCVVVSLTACTHEVADADRQGAEESIAEVSSALSCITEGYADAGDALVKVDYCCGHTRLGFLDCCYQVYEYGPGPTWPSSYWTDCHAE
jgi:hypothetical protein